MRNDLSITRLFVLRGAYLLVGLGLANMTWPLILRSAATPPEHMQGVVRAILTAVSLLALLGVRYVRGTGDRWRNVPTRQDASTMAGAA